MEIISVWEWGTIKIFSGFESCRVKVRDKELITVERLRTENGFIVWLFIVKSEAGNVCHTTTEKVEYSAFRLQYTFYSWPPHISGKIFSFSVVHIHYSNQNFMLFCRLQEWKSSVCLLNNAYCSSLYSKILLQKCILSTKCLRHIKGFE